MPYVAASGFQRVHTVAHCMSTGADETAMGDGRGVRTESGIKCDTIEEATRPREDAHEPKTKNEERGRQVHADRC